jgi:precorrin-3B synthase
VPLPTLRERPDRCPGALRPWPAEDGLLVRLRLIGGRLSSEALTALIAVAERYGDGRMHLTGRANLQLRGLPGQAGEAGVLAPDALAAIEATGLLPSRAHDLVRNVMVSPQAGLAGGRADLRPVAAELDALLLASPSLATLPGRFLFVLDDGRGDLVGRPCDLGLVALSATEAQLRLGSAWGPVVGLAEAAAVLARLAAAFLSARGSGPGAAWHVEELAEPLAEPHRADPGLPVPAGPLPYGAVPGGRHVAVPDGLDGVRAATLATAASELVVTPWRGILVPDAPEETR